MTASSRPTVDTKYPGLEVLPHKVTFTLAITRARWMALFPLMKPTTCDPHIWEGSSSSCEHGRASGALPRSGYPSAPPTGRHRQMAAKRDIQRLPPACGCSRLEFRRCDRRKRQTATASPAEPGGLPLTLESSRSSSTIKDRARLDYKSLSYPQNADFLSSIVRARLTHLG
jgi:hypothetical protein